MREVTRREADVLGEEEPVTGDLTREVELAERRVDCVVAAGWQGVDRDPDLGEDHLLAGLDGPDAEGLLQAEDQQDPRSGGELLKRLWNVFLSGMPTTLRMG